MTMNAEELYQRLKPLQEAKGAYFNQDKSLVFDLLDGLIKNRDRYGYMACPCRLASEDRQQDRDIICPCWYRKPDIDEFGACFCALYVSKDVAEGKKTPDYVPERRPPEKIL
jgi:ferredoxin-thioredoxin reductase catalytic subunit